MYERSLLTIHALTSKKTGAVAAGARDGWAYVWPRDAATAALALEASGHRSEARAVTKFLTALNLNAAARFTESGAPVPGRAAQGDAAGWVTAAAGATGIPAPHEPFPWRNRADYQESSAGTYLGNALAAANGASSLRGSFANLGPQDGGWCAPPATRPRDSTPPPPGRSARSNSARSIQLPNEPSFASPKPEPPPASPPAKAGRAGKIRGWPRPPGAPGPSRALPGRAPRDRAALKLLTDLRRASTPAGDLPERVGAHTGIPTSTTPLLWSSAFAVLALRQLWP